MRKFLLFISFVFFFSISVQAQPTINASLGTNEYGTSNAFTVSNGSPTWYFTWDNTYIYGLLLNANETEPAVMYFDFDAATPVNSGSGNSTGFNYDGTTADLPFNADAVIYFKADYREIRTGSSFSTLNQYFGSGADNSSDYTNGFYSSNQNGNGAGSDDRREFRIAWTDLGLGARPTNMNFFGYVQNFSSFIYAEVPTANPSGTNSSPDMVRYFTVINTGTSPSQSPFTNESYTHIGGDITSFGGINIYDFTMNTGSATITRNAASGNNWVINGNLVVNNGTVVFNSTASTCTIANSLDVRGTGVLNLGGSSVTLLSSASNTARVAAVTGSLTGASNVTVERYIPAKRAWRLLTAPLTGSSNNSIFRNWQNNDAVNGNTGVEIWTTSGNGGVANPSNINSGLALGGGNSLLSYNVVTQSWNAVTNTNSNNLFSASDNTPYCLFVSGPYNNGSGNIYSGATATTLSATGSLRTGNVTVNAGTLNANQYYLVSNPYASPVNPNTLSGTNLSNSFFMWDPNLAGNNGVGGYVTYNRSGNTYNVTTASYSNSPVSQVQSGQAFFIQANANGATDILFEEADKSSTVNNGQFRTTATYEKLRITLFKDIASVYTVMDGAVAMFDANDGQKGLDYFDGRKLANSFENIAFVRSNTNLVFEHRPLVTDKDTLYLNIWNTTAGNNYSLAINAEDMTSMSGLQAVLKDAYLNTETPLNLNGTVTNINFSVDANAASTGDRFMIVFRNTAALPVSFLNIKAYQQQAGINVEWHVGTEINVAGYEVEESADGRTFTKATMLNATGNSNYNWYDAAVNKGDNFYRIKSIDRDGTTKYSAVVNVKLGNKQDGITVYPNPVKGGRINVQIQGEKGSYTARLLNTQGQTVWSQTLGHTGGSATQTLQMNKNLTAGNYVLELNNGTKTYTQKIVIE